MGASEGRGMLKSGFGKAKMAMKCKENLESNGSILQQPDFQQVYVLAKTKRCFSTREAVLFGSRSAAFCLEKRHFFNSGNRFVKKVHNTIVLDIEVTDPTPNPSP